MIADLTTLQATVHGRVQGVFFRAYVARHARELGLTGYVRNMPGGTVEVRAEGERQKLEILAGYLKEGPRGARVDEVITVWSEYTGNFPDFSLRY